MNLVDTLEYRIAEAMYEGDTHQIAGELDVILEVIHDYQTGIRHYADFIGRIFSQPSKPIPHEIQQSFSFSVHAFVNEVLGLMNQV